jgi:hypothetical protein
LVEPQNIHLHNQPLLDPGILFGVGYMWLQGPGIRDVLQEELRQLDFRMVGIEEFG